MPFAETRRQPLAACYFAEVTGFAPYVTKTIAGLITVFATAAVAACNSSPNVALQDQLEASQLASDLQVQFAKGADASNRAVMADTDETSVAFAKEAEQSTQAIEKDSAALRPLLTRLQYSSELGFLDEFDKRFADYRALDRRVLELAVENTNLKAQSLSFGPVQDTADAFRSALDMVTAAKESETWRVRAIAASAVAAVREIQALQAPHIAEADDASMKGIEGRMKSAEGVARNALKTLASLASSDSRAHLAAASTALDRFVELNGQVIALSRRNTNVRSLALSLGQKRMLTAGCEDSLRALRDALSKRGFSATR
jgi:hypothetical protein